MSLGILKSMNFLNLLTPEKHVAGIEISDSVIRIALLHPRKKVRKGKEGITPSPQGIRGIDTILDLEKYDLTLIEEPIAANIIEGGVVRDRDLLAKTLATLWAKANLGTRYAIVSIPHDAVYSRRFSFPKTILGERLDEAMKLALSFQIPMKTETAYLDWERVPATASPTSNEILFAMIPRTVVEGYMYALDAAGIKTLAMESHLASIARSIEVDPSTITIFTEKTPDGVIVFGLKNGLVYFSRTLPTQFIAENEVDHEVKKIIESQSTDAKDIVVMGDLYTVPLKEPYRSSSSVTEPKTKWSIALGALERGRIPEGLDNLISFLPVGTEEAYAFQKKTTFAVLIRNITIGVSLFFVVAFLAAYLFIFSLAQSASRTVTANISGTPPQFAKEEAFVKQVNALTETAEKIFTKAPRWSTIIEEVNTLIISGITVSNFSAGSITEELTLTGTARDRNTLNQFKKTLQESPLLTNVNIPIANLELKEKIPFTATFRIKDPSTVYYYR